MFTVTAVSGHKMILEDAGRDKDGCQLWRQVKVGIGMPWPANEPSTGDLNDRLKVSRLRLLDSLT